MKKCLYEVTNGYVGFTYVRVYVYAESEKRAIDLAAQSFQADAAGRYPASYYRRSKLKATLLFCDGDAEFATKPSDEGWELSDQEG